MAFFIILSLVLIIWVFGFLVILFDATIHSLFSLVLVFILSSVFLLVALQTEFLAYSYMIVCIGAIAVLFLFVIMLVDMRSTTNVNSQNLDFFSIFFMFLTFFILLSLGYNTFIFSSWDSGVMAGSYNIEEVLSYKDKIDLTTFFKVLTDPNSKKWNRLDGQNVYDYKDEWHAQFVKFTGYGFPFDIDVGPNRESIKYTYQLPYHLVTFKMIEKPLPIFDYSTNFLNIKYIWYLYTEYYLLFITIGYILLVAMVGSLALCMQNFRTSRLEFK